MLNHDQQIKVLHVARCILRDQFYGYPFNFDGGHPDIPGWIETLREVEADYPRTSIKQAIRFLELLQEEPEDTAPLRVSQVLVELLGALENSMKETP